MKSKFTTIFTQQLESIQLMSKLLTNIQSHQAFLVNYFYNSTRSTLWRWPTVGLFFCRDRHDVPASQSAQDNNIASKLWNRTASKMTTTGHCNPVRKNNKVIKSYFSKFCLVVKIILSFTINFSPLVTCSIKTIQKLVDWCTFRSTPLSSSLPPLDRYKGVQILNVLNYKNLST